jgi:hypothetical protein
MGQRKPPPLPHSVCQPRNRTEELPSGRQMSLPLSYATPLFIYPWVSLFTILITAPWAWCYPLPRMGWHRPPGEAGAQQTQHVLRPGGRSHPGSWIRGSHQGTPSRTQPARRQRNSFDIIVFTCSWTFSHTTWQVSNNDLQATNRLHLLLNHS